MDPDRLERVHRHLVIFGLLDLGILVLILNLVLLSGNTVLGGFSVGIGALVLLYGLVVSNGFRKRITGYDLKFVSLLSFLAGFLIIVGIVQSVLALISGELSLLIQAAAIFFLGWSTRRRIATVRHPLFVQWFASGTDSEVNLREHEVYASCPHCSSLLAVIPSKLTIEDRCPNCEGFLVTSFEEE